MIKLKDISFKYNNANEDVLKKVSLTLEKGKTLAVIGPSGGGKSTLLRVISGLEMPYQGTMEIEGKEIVGSKVFVEPEKRGVGMLFQDYALFPHLNIRKNIEFGLKNKTKSEKAAIVAKMLNLVNLQGYEKRFPNELSGGQQQRIALARALAPEPSLLLLDEPFSNLDASLQESVREEMFSIIRKQKMTTIMVTHNPEDANGRTDYVMEIRDGLGSILD